MPHNDDHMTFILARAKADPGYAIDLIRDFDGTVRKSGLTVNESSSADDRLTEVIASIRNSAVLEKANDVLLRSEPINGGAHQPESTSAPNPPRSLPSRGRAGGVVNSSQGGKKIVVTIEVIDS